MSITGAKSDRLSILISGAGIAGPTLAYWLRQRGFAVTLVEQAPRFREGGYMIDFWGIGYDVAERMNLLPRLRENGYFIQCIKFIDEKNHVRSQLAGDVLRRAIGDRFISLPRGDLASAIFDAVAEKVEIIFDESVTEIREDSTGVEVSFERSAPRRFDLVVGCDGLHSRVREIVFGPEDKFEKYLGYYAASFVTTGYPICDELSYVSYAAPARQISRYALRGDRTAFLFVFAREEPFAKPPHYLDAKAVLREIFSRDRWIEIPEIMERLENCDDLYFDSVSQIRMPKWSDGRIAFLGDAAYCPSLLAGEGAGFAMAGGYILAGELDRAGGNHIRAFAAYEQRFRSFIERKQGAAVQFAGSFAPRTRFGLFLRDLVLRASSISGVGQWLMRRFVADEFDLPNYSA